MKIKRTIVFLSLALIVGSATIKAKAAQAQTSAPKTEASNTQQKETSPADASNSLSDAQKQAIQMIRSESIKRDMVGLFRAFRTYTQISANMLAEKPDEELGQRLDKELKDIGGELFSIRVQSFQDALKVLTPQQKQLLRSEVTKFGAPADILNLIAHIFNLPEMLPMNERVAPPH